MSENIRLALKGIMSHKLRSILTMLGVIIGIASIIAIVSTIKGTNEQIMQNLIGAGNNNVTVSLMQGDGEYWMDAGVPGNVIPVTESQKKEIRELDSVADASFYLKRKYASDITAGVNALSGGSMFGIDSHYLSTTGYVVYKGRPFIESDYEKFHKVALLDEKAVELLFPEKDPIGRTVELQGEPFTVVGLIRKADSFQPVIETIQDYETYTREEYGMVLIPDADWPILYNYDEPQDCVARAVSTEKMRAAAETTRSPTRRRIFWRRPATSRSWPTARTACSSGSPASLFWSEASASQISCWCLSLRGQTRSDSKKRSAQERAGSSRSF